MKEKFEGGEGDFNNLQIWMITLYDKHSLSCL